MNPERPVLLDELKLLKKAERSVNAQLAGAVKRWQRETAALKIARRNVENALKRIAKRRAIINGRLAK